MKKIEPSYVLYGDVIGSRSISDRPAFTKKIGATIERVNELFEKQCLAPLKIEKGLDEVAAAAQTPIVLLQIATEISRLLLPQQMRFVIAAGNIDTAVEGRDVSRMDGDAFHKAAAMLSELKSEKLWLKCDTTNRQFDYAAENQLNALMLVKKNWTARQVVLYQTYGEHKNQVKVAEIIGVTQQVISKQMTAIDANEVMKVEEKFDTWIKEQAV